MGWGKLPPTGDVKCMSGRCDSFWKAIEDCLLWLSQPGALIRCRLGVAPWYAREGYWGWRGIGVRERGVSGGRKGVGGGEVDAFESEL